MKKLLLISVIAILAFGQIKAQDPIFVKGDKVVSVGLGLGGGYLYSGSGYKMTFPPLTGSFEVGVKDDVLEKGSLGLGGVLGYTGYKWEYNNNYGWKYSNIIIGGRGYFHYPLISKLDTYTGLTLGYNIASSTYYGSGTPFDDTSSYGGFIWAWFVGGRYYFNEKVAGLLELGYGVSYLTIGVAFKL